MRQFLAELRARLGAASVVARQIAGAPDYGRYLAHVQANHPGTRPLEWAEFYRTRLEDRYSKPGAKCC